MRTLILCVTFLGFLLGGPVWAADGAAPGVDRQVKLDPIVLPTLRKGRPDRQITLVIMLELAEGQSRSSVSDVMPKLRDAYITELMTLLDYDWPGGAVLDLEFARKRLMMRSGLVLGDKVVSRILFEAVRERRL